MHSVLIVEDDAGTRERLRMLLAKAVPGARCIEADSLRSGHARLADAVVDTVLIDVGLPDGSGLHLLPQLRALPRPVDGIVISSLGDDATVLQALRAGAVGYLSKNASDLEIELSLCSIARGGAPIDPVIARRILALLVPPVASSPADPAAAPLTHRERDVLELVAQGLSNRAIAERLGLSVNTVESHAKSIYRKLAVRSRVGAVRTARAQGLLN